MVLKLEAIIYCLFFLDSLGAVLIAFFSPGFVKYYNKRYKKLSKHLPLTKGWALVYLTLVLWIGCALNRMGLLFY
ncbi:MAG: hypothetical protein ABH811_02335 [archaeon]